MTYRDFKDLTRRTASDKILGDKAFNIAKNPKYDGNQMGLVSMAYNLFDKKNGGATTFAKKNLLLKMKIYQTKN